MTVRRVVQVLVAVVALAAAAGAGVVYQSRKAPPAAAATAAPASAPAPAPEAAPVKEALPGGSCQCNKCFHPGGFAIDTPACGGGHGTGHGAAVTAPPGGNFRTLCNICCLGTFFNCP